MENILVVLVHLNILCELTENPINCLQQIWRSDEFGSLNVCYF